MTGHRLKRLTFASLTLTLLLGAASQYATAHHGGGHIGTASSGHMNRQTCRYSRSDGHHGWSRTEVKLGIRCAVRRWPVPGGADFAIAVAACESGLRPKAVSASGTFRGLYQQHRDYWQSRYRALRPARFDLKPSALNARSNIVVSIRMAHRSGWGAWVCA